VSESASNGEMHTGLKATVGPVDLGGMKSGYQMKANINNNYVFISGGTPLLTSQLDDLGGLKNIQNTVISVYKDTLFKDSFAKTYSILFWSVPL
jgi:hypothetical protein